MRYLLAFCSTCLAALALGCTSPVTTASPPGPDPTPVASPSAATYREVTVAALVDLTGPNASAGRAVQAGLEVSLDDVNHYFAEQASSIRLKLLIEDGASDKDVALSKLQGFDSLGLKLVIGPDSSDGLAHIKEYANQHGIVLISPSSTAPSLALEDNILRTAPVDYLQARAIAALLHDQDIKSIVTLYRDDSWGNELNQELSHTVGVLSMSLEASRSYPTIATSYASVIASLSASVRQAIGQVGTQSVAVGLISFDEASDIFLAAKDDPTLQAVQWFGCDGNALSPAIATDPAASAFATQTKFLASTFLPPFEAGHPAATRSSFIPAFETIQAAIRARLGSKPVAYAFTAYDSLWLAGLVGRKLEGFPGSDQVLDALWLAAYELRGASGPLRLNPDMDRVQGDYGFFGLNGNDWVRRALYLDASDPASPLDDRLPTITYTEGSP